MSNKNLDFDRYGLIYLPSHLITSGEKDKLLQVIRDDRFESAQRKQLPDEPKLPLQTLDATLGFVLSFDSAGEITEILLKYLEATTNVASPLSAFHEYKLELAFELANLQDRPYDLLWLLLFINELFSTSDNKKAHAILDKVLNSKTFTLLSGEYSMQGAFLLASLANYEAEIALDLSRKIFIDEGKEFFGKYLADFSNHSLAVSIFQQISELSHRKKALKHIALALLKQNELDFAIKVIQENSKDQTKTEIVEEIILQLVSENLSTTAFDFFENSGLDNLSTELLGNMASLQIQ